MDRHDPRLGRVLAVATHRSSRLRFAVPLLLLLLLSIVVLATNPAGAEARPGATSAEVIGGDDYFLCCAAQTVKIIGLFTANPWLVLGGAVAGGVACGYGW